MEWQHPQWLYLILPLGAAWLLLSLYSRRRRLRAAEAFVAQPMWSRILPPDSRARFWVKTLLREAALVTGLIVVYSFWLCLVTLTFWFVKIENIEQIVWQAFEAGRYPVEIYPVWLRGALTYVVPVAFIITVPAQALAGRLAHPILVIAPVVAVCALVYRGPDVAPRRSRSPSVAGCGSLRAGRPSVHGRRLGETHRARAR